MPTKDSVEAEIEGRQLKRFRKVTPRRGNDILGDVGYDLVFLAEDRELAGELAEALRAEGVPTGGRGTKRARDWHIYAHCERILEQKTLTAEGCAFTCPYYKGRLADYSPDMWPNAFDLVDCALHISIDQWWTEEDCGDVAKAINKVFGVLC